MARPRDELSEQITSRARFTEGQNRGSVDRLAEQASTVAAAPPGVRRKVTARDANYTEDGTPPFICGNCRYILFDKGAPAGDLCQLVDGPHPGGHIDPGDTCRLWLAKPAYGTSDFADGQTLPEEVDDGGRDGGGAEPVGEAGPPDPDSGDR